MVRERQGQRLEEWLRRADESGVSELQNFAAGIKRDKAAVFAGLTLAYSSERVAYCTQSARSSLPDLIHSRLRCPLSGHLAGRQNKQLPLSL